VKDPLFKNSIRLVFWTFLTPIFLLIIFSLVKISGCNNEGALITSLSSFLAGVISLLWWQGWKKWRHHRHCKSLKKNKKHEFEQWASQRSNIMTWVKKISA